MGCVSQEEQRAFDFICAAADADVTKAKQLLAQGVPIDVCDYDKRTALMVSAAAGHEVCVVIDSFGVSNKSFRRGLSTPTPQTHFRFVMCTSLYTHYQERKNTLPLPRRASPSSCWKRKPPPTAETRLATQPCQRRWLQAMITSLSC